MVHGYTGHQDKTTAANKGFTSRKALTAQSKSEQMIGKLHLDLFCQEKYSFRRSSGRDHQRRPVCRI